MRYPFHSDGKFPSDFMNSPNQPARQPEMGNAFQQQQFFPYDTNPFMNQQSANNDNKQFPWSSPQNTAQPFNMEHSFYGGFPFQSPNPYITQTPPSQQATPQQQPPWPMAPFQPGPFKPMKPGGIMGYFHDKDGQLNVDKVLSTVGHAASTFQQLTPMVKSLGSFFSAFRG